MKKLKKILALICCLLMVAVMMVGCSKKKEEANPADLIIGEWELDSVDSGSSNSDLMLGIAMMKSMGATMDFEFTKTEMTMRATVWGMSESDTMTYEIDGNKISFGDGSTLTFKISGKTLTLSDSTDTLILKRK